MKGANRLFTSIVGVAVLIAVSASPTTVNAPDLSETTWSLSEIRVPGAYLDLLTKKNARISFKENGRFTASAGCNIKTGRWATTGDTIVFSETGTTLMNCGLGRVMEQETALANNLLLATSWSINDGVLELRGVEGTLLVRALSPGIPKPDREPALNGSQIGGIR